MDDATLVKNGLEVLALETPRLILRQWKAEDYEPFAAMNACPKVMEFFPSPLTTAESNALVDKCKTRITNHGWGLYAVEDKNTGRFIGLAGLQRIGSILPMYPAIEIVWRFSSEYWGQGYATEAANTVLGEAFTRLKLDRVIAFTPLLNTPSWKLMERLGMVNTGQNFRHPVIEGGTPLAAHCLYELSRAEYWSQK